MRICRIIALGAALLVPGVGTTLQQLSLNDLVQKSTAIVRGKAQLTSSALKGSIIYTHYKVQVTEQWKGSPAALIDVAVPGGTVNGRMQTFSGAPVFNTGQEYIFFLWTSRSGLTQVMGLSQGIFNLTPSSTGDLLVARAAATDRMVNAAGTEINDSNFSMRLPDFKSRVTTALVKGSN